MEYLYCTYNGNGKYSTKKNMPEIERDQLLYLTFVLA